MPLLPASGVSAAGAPAALAEAGGDQEDEEEAKRLLHGCRCLTRLWASVAAFITEGRKMRFSPNPQEFLPLSRKFPLELFNMSINGEIPGTLSVLQNAPKGGVTADQTGKPRTFRKRGKSLRGKSVWKKRRAH